MRNINEKKTEFAININWQPFSYRAGLNAEVRQFLKIAVTLHIYAWAEQNKKEFNAKKVEILRMKNDDQNELDGWFQIVFLTIGATHHPLLLHLRFDVSLFYCV